MRFLLTLGLLGVVGATSCFPKNASPNHAIGLCDVADSPANVEIISTGAVTINIPQWNPAHYPNGAVLDAVYLNGLVASYEPVATYKFGGQNTGIVEVSVPTGWNLFSTVDNKVIGSGVLGQFGSGFPGWGTVDSSIGDTDIHTGGCIFRDKDTNNNFLTCKDGINLMSLPFTIKDHTYQSTAYTGDTNTAIDFTPDFSLAGTYTDFVSDDPTATSGYKIAASNIGAGVSGYVGTGTWGLTTAKNNLATASTVDGGVFQQSSGPAITVTVTHHLKLTVEVQYDYHLPQVSGDPQFAGFQGQSFQVHGAPDAYFALISAPSYYVNARFDYISTGSCTYNETACFTHPGTYMGMIYVGMKDANILIQAGPHSTGFASILVNDKPMTSGDRFTLSTVSSDSYIQVLSKSKLILNLDNIMITVHNSDLFVNFDLALNDKNLLSTGSIHHTIPSGSTPSQVQHHLNKWYGTYNPLHGLIGQTWRNVQYQDHKLYQGDITEYQVDKIIDHTFLYCVYQA